MSRTKFIYAYIAGVIAAFYGGAPWSYIFVLMSPKAEAIETPAHFYAIALIAPVALVWLAYVRGQSIGRSRLALFPLGALLLSLVGVVWDRYLSGAPAALNRGTTTALVSLFVLYGPGLVHAICFSIGAKLRSPSTPGRNGDLGNEPRTRFDSGKQVAPMVLAMAFVNLVAILPLAFLFRLTASDSEMVFFCVVAALFVVGFTATGIALAKGKYRDSAVAITGMAWPCFVAAFIALDYLLRLTGSRI